MSALLSFLGGSAFRMVWGEASAFITKRQDHKYELERLQHQERLDAATHERNLAGMRVQHDLGIKEIYVQQEAATAAGELDAWVETVKATGRMTGVAWIDGWNQSIRPAVATAALVAMFIDIAMNQRLTAWHIEVFSAALGIYLADRTLHKRGK
jgi:hypothetical protein